MCPLSDDALLDWALAPREADPELVRHLQDCRACRERSIRVEDIEGDIAAYIERIEVSENFKSWVLERLRHSFAEEAATTEALVQAR